MSLQDPIQQILSSKIKKKQLFIKQIADNDCSIEGITQS